MLIRVDDEGEGIPEEIRVRVFTKFWKHGVRGGTGLGMYIVNGLVRVHGGEVRITDADSGGARLEIRLALRRPPLSASAPDRRPSRVNRLAAWTGGTS